MNRVINLIMVLVFLIVGQSCQNSGKGNKNKDGIRTAVVQEVLQAGQYTYLRVKEDDSELWLAVSAMQAEVGKTYYYKEGMEMTNFHSKELNRDFPEVYFIDNFSADPNMKSTVENIPEHGDMGGMGSHSGMGDHNAMQGVKPQIEKQDVKVTPASGGITIAELYGKQEKYSGKSVKITGKVIKFSPEIMGKNWIHIQDGTENKGDFDLTVTSMATVKAGDIITIEGKVALNKDFGAGYFYKVIVEDATIK